MAINPLELQTFFSQMNNVGKLQSGIKEAELLKQEIANNEIQKKSEKDADDIPETKNTKDYSKINDKEKENNSNKNKKKKENKNDEIEEENNEKNEKTKLNEPFLGNKIDIIG